jgi:uncharacterized membrane protein YraQ (UPF0718 family)
LEITFLFIVISFLVALLQKYIPESKIQSALKGKKGYIFAGFLGAITPFCSCSTVPMLRGLLKANAPFGAVLTFLFTSPLLNPIIVAIFITTFGLKITLAYVLIALFASLFGGIVLNLLGFSRYIIPVETKVACCPAKAPASAPKSASANFSAKVKASFREAIQNFKPVWIYILLGTSIGSLIHGFVPSEIISRYGNSENIFAIPFAAIIGIPLYVRLEMLIPLSSILVSKGMSLGAVMALIIGGGGASLTELILLKSIFKTPMLVAFVVVIVAMAIFSGYFFQFVF